MEYLKPAALSLACREGDMDHVKSLIKKYNCDPRGLCLIFCVHLPSDEVMVRRYFV